MYKSVRVPTTIAGCVFLKGVYEPEMTIEERLMTINYKVGSMNEHLLKHKRLGSEIQMLEFKTNLAETICHCLTMATILGYNVTELVDLGWEKIGDRFADFEADFEKGKEK